MRRSLSKSDIKSLNLELQIYDFSFSKKDNVEVFEKEGFSFIIVNRQPFFFYHDSKPVPTLKALIERKILKSVVVDMGAVKFIVSGADVMRPGIRSIEHGFSQGDPVVVLDEKNSKPLAVGIALFSSEDMQAAVSGRVIKNIHFAGDKIWNIISEV